VKVTAVALARCAAQCLLIVLSPTLSITCLVVKTWYVCVYYQGADCCVAGMMLKHASCVWHGVVWWSLAVYQHLWYWLVS
jgi:hypothetical protein